MGVNWVQPQTVRDVSIAWRRRSKEELDSRCLEADTIGYLVEHIEREEWPDFEGKTRTIHDYKLHF